MVSSHFKQHVRPEILRRWFNFLKQIYPFYEDEQMDEGKIDRIFDDCEEELEMDEEGDFVEVQDSILQDGVEEEAEETEYITKDPVRKNQTETSQSSMLLPENIEKEARIKPRNRKEGEGLILAPGEDQIPRNILMEKNPFVLHFPSLFPDGKGGLHDPERKRKITSQDWIGQRLRNMNPVFAQNKPFVFSAVYLVEQQHLTNKMNINFMRGKFAKNPDGSQFMQTEDGYAVFDNIIGSPRYWQKMKLDLIAKLEQLGPSAFFYTLSCANKRWQDNLATILAKTRPDLKVMHYKEELSTRFLDINLTRSKEKEQYEDEDENDDVAEESFIIPEENEHNTSSQQHEDYFVHEEVNTAVFQSLSDAFKCKTHHQCSRKPLNIYIEKQEANKLQAENVIEITRNFNNRVKAFRTQILTSKQSPLQIEYYHDRTEFQAR